jgi:surface antigen
VNRTVGVRVRRSVGRGAIFALGVGGALSATPHQPAMVSASVVVLPNTSVVADRDDPLPRQPRATVMIYVEATPPPPAKAAAPPLTASAPLRATSARISSSAPSRAVGAVAGEANGFSYGYCTWWVAHKRPIPWRGNAYQWWWNARSFGFAEGATPRVGAVMVMGISGSSPQGHVAYVESVNPDGAFVVSEMNWWGVAGGGWNRVDYRTITSTRGLLGFIY